MPAKRHEGSIYAKKKSLWELEPLLGRSVLLKCTDDRRYCGTLRGFDSNMNMVLVNAIESFGSEEVQSRSIPAVMIRGGFIMAVMSDSGRREVANPYE